MTTHNLQLLEKLAQIHSWHRKCCHFIHEIALQTPEEFCEKFAQIETWLSNSKPDEPLPQAKEALDKLEYTIYEVVVGSDPLRDLILASPLLSEADVDELCDYASIADVTPDPEAAIMLNSKDDLFMKLLDLILKQFSPTPDQLFKDNLSALFTLQQEYPELLAPVFQLADLYNWSELLRNIQSNLNRASADGKKPEHLPPAAMDLFQMISDHDRKEAEAMASSVPSTNSPQVPSKPSMRDFLFREVGITTIQRAEVLLFEGVQGSPPALESSLQRASWTTFSAREKGIASANALLKQGVISDEAAQPIKDRIARRIESAKHYVGLREYVKFNALNHAWPELSSELINDRPLFEAFEARMVDTDTLAKEADGPGELARLLQRYMSNDPLIRFLQLRPYFSGLNLKKAREIYDLSSSLPQAETVKAKPEPVLEPVTVSQLTGAQAPSIAELGTSPEVFTNLNISIVAGSEPVTNDEEFQCQVSVGMAGSTPRIEASLRIRKQDIESIKNNAYNLMRVPYGYGGGGARAARRDVSPERAMASDPAQRGLLSVYIKDIGLQLSTLFFTPQITEFIVHALNSHPKIRFVLDIRIPDLLSLPWECLYIADLKLPVALVSKHSLVRHFPATNRMLSQVWGSKIKILAVFSSPVDVGQLMLEEEEKVLKEVFAGVGRVDLRTRSHITLDDFSSEMRTFNPQIIHFSGHGVVNKETGQGALIFENEQGEAKWVHASQFSALCRDQNVSLVVLNACDTGTAVANDAVTSVAGALIDTGIPATVATTRAIYDIQSIMFVREFYRAIVDGYPIESAMAEARKRVNSEDWDWSAFALFVSTLDLDRYKVILERK